MKSRDIWACDQYDLRKFAPDKIDYFLDIGACVGTASVLFKSVCPNAKVIAVEPCLENYEVLKVAAGTWDVRCHHLALGNGEKLCFGRRSPQGHRFYTTEEKQWWPEDPEYFVDSKSLPEMFRLFGIKKRYIIKSDTEGGERFILDDTDSVDIIRNSIQFNLEYHRGFGGEEERWHEWFRQFADTHILLFRTRDKDGDKCVYEETTGPEKENWRSEFVLRRRNWDGS